MNSSLAISETHTYTRAHTHTHVFSFSSAIMFNSSYSHHPLKALQMTFRERGGERERGRERGKERMRERSEAIFHLQN